MPESDYRRKDAPIHPLRWRALAIWAVALSAAVIFAYFYSRAQARQTCQGDRILISKIILRQYGITFKQYQHNKPHVNDQIFLATLKGNFFLRNHPKEIQKQLTYTHNVLIDADPGNCAPTF